MKANRCLRVININLEKHEEYIKLGFTLLHIITFIKIYINKPNGKHQMGVIEILH